MARQAIAAKRGAAVVLEEKSIVSVGEDAVNRVLIDKAIQNSDVQDAGFRERDRPRANARRHPECRAVGRETAWWEPQSRPVPSDRT